MGWLLDFALFEILEKILEDLGSEGLLLVVVVSDGVHQRGFACVDQRDVVVELVMLYAVAMHHILII